MSIFTKIATSVSEQTIRLASKTAIFNRNPSPILGRAAGMGVNMLSGTSFGDVMVATAASINLAGNSITLAGIAAAGAIAAGTFAATSKRFKAAKSNHQNDSAGFVNESSPQLKM